LKRPWEKTLEKARKSDRGRQGIPTTDPAALALSIYSEA